MVCTANQDRAHLVQALKHAYSFKPSFKPMTSHDDSRLEMINVDDLAAEGSSSHSPQPRRRPDMMLFATVEVWVVFLIIISALVGTVFFGAAARHYALGGESLGRFGPIIDSIASFPANAKRVLAGNSKTTPMLAIEQRFAGDRGFKFSYPPSSRPDMGYLLLNRYDGDRKASTAELWDLNAQSRVHQWTFEGVKVLWQESKLSSQVDFRSDLNVNRYTPFHALLDETGTLITHGGGGPLIKADPCSRLTLLDDSAIYHHSIENDAEGNLWVPTRIEPKTMNVGGPYLWEDGISMLTPSGEIRYRRSILSILIENGLDFLILGRGASVTDPTHLNDVQPALIDGAYWKKGDLFISLRHQSLVFLFRPLTGKILWFQQGPWIHQHDVDIVDKKTISIFDNNAALIGMSDWAVRGVNRQLVYDFERNSLLSPWQRSFEKLQIRTKTNGLSEKTGNELFVEETNYGRLVQFQPEGQASWQFVNRAKDGLVYYLTWSRLIPRELGDRALAAIRRTQCG